jgi:hypothetical protein
LLRSVAGSVALSLACVGGAVAEPAWYTPGVGGFNDVRKPDGTVVSGVVDFYQHQNWIFDPASTTTFKAKTDWEKAGGWCQWAAIGDVFFDLQEKGYTKLLPSGAGSVTDPKQWFDAVYSPADISKSALLMLRSAIIGKTISDYLATQGYGPGSATPLLAGRTAVNADGKVGNTGMSIFDYYNEKTKFGDELILRLTGGGVPNVASDKQGMWWNGTYHMMAGAGLSVKDKTVFVADPDSNRGSGLSNAGWPKVATFPGALKTAATDPLPLPTKPVIGTAASYNSFYQGLTFDKNKVKGDDPATVYNGQVVTHIYTIGKTEGAQRASAPAPGGVETTIDVSAGETQVDAIWIDPLATVLDPTTLPSLFDFTSSGSTWSPQREISDPFGNATSFGGVEYTLDTGSGLAPGQDGLADLGTDTSFSQFDIFLHFAGDPLNLWDPQTIGGPNTLDIATDQTVPEPSSLLLLAPALGLGLRRRRVRAG